MAKDDGVLQVLAAECKRRDQPWKRLAALQEKLARESAEMAVNSYCVPYRDRHGRWMARDNGPASFDDEKQVIDEALEYLTLCDRIVQHPVHPGRFKIGPVKV